MIYLIFNRLKKRNLKKFKDDNQSILHSSQNEESYNEDYLHKHPKIRHIKKHILPNMF